MNVDQLTGVYKKMSRGIVNLVFRCTSLTEPASSTPEAAMAARVPLSTVETLMDSAFAVRVIDGAKAGHVSVRAHDGTRLVETTNRS